MLSVELESNEDPWHFWFPTVWRLHWAVVSTIWVWVTSMVLSAFCRAELHESGYASLAHGLLPASIFMRCGVRYRPERSVIGGGCEDDWMLHRDVVERAWHPSCWRGRWSEWAADAWVLGDGQLDSLI